MGIEISIKGAPLINVESISVRSSVTSLVNTFSAIVSDGLNAPTDGRISNLNFKRGETALIKIDEKTVINGFIRAVRVTSGIRKKQIELVGYDRVIDFVKSSAPLNINESTPITFEKLLRSTLDKMGLSVIGITNLLPDSANTTIREFTNIESEIEQTGLQFIEPYARLKQILMRGNGDGTILLSRAGGDQVINTPLVNVPDRSENNIISGMFTESEENRFNSYTFKSSEDFSADGFAGDAADSVNNTGEAIDKEIRETRKIIMQTEESASPEECKNRAAWDANLRRAQAVQYEATVYGFSIVNTDVLFGTTKILWEPNSRVFVYDILANIKSEMLIESVTYIYSRVDGSTSVLNLVAPDSYLIQASRDEVDARISLLGKVDDL